MCRSSDTKWTRKQKKNIEHKTCKHDQMMTIIGNVSLLYFQ